MEDRREPVILLVEDSNADVALLQHAFKQAGLQRPLQVVRDGVEAMSYLLGLREFNDRDQHPHPDILLIDLNMPRLNGLELLTWLRTQPDLQHLVVIVLSGTARPDDINLAYRMGAKSYFVKPLRSDELQSFINCFYQYWVVTNFLPVAEAENVGNNG